MGVTGFGPRSDELGTNRLGEPPGWGISVAPQGDAEPVEQAHVDQCRHSPTLTRGAARPAESNEMVVSINA